jgi:hypothetical protein
MDALGQLSGSADDDLADDAERAQQSDCGQHGNRSERGADPRAPAWRHEDAILELPQSAERFEGATTFTAWRRQYPADPEQMRYRVRLVTARVDLAAVEVSVSYDGTSWMQGVQLLEFRGNKVARERIYLIAAWEAPEWRAP